MYNTIIGIIGCNAGFINVIFYYNMSYECYDDAQWQDIKLLPKPLLIIYYITQTNIIIFLYIIYDIINVHF